MRLLKEEDPAGVSQRAKWRLKRRIYRNKVYILLGIHATVMFVNKFSSSYSRDQITSGMLMGMIN